MRTLTSTIIGLMASGMLLLANPAHAIDLATVTIGNVGNPADSSGFGTVDYAYSIGKYEVTAGQYAEFLNAVATTDPYGLYSTMMWNDPQGCKIQRNGVSGAYTYSVASDWANRPVNYIDWGDAARFTNWLHNGQPVGTQGPGTTEDGSYFLNGATDATDLLNITRDSDATWVLPTQNEWYKPAYHKNDGATGNYFDYPTSSDNQPANLLADPDPGNNANYYQGDYTIGSPYYRTTVGQFENSSSPYGTFDQGGNVWEWTETLVSGFVDARAVRGGSFENEFGNSMLHADNWFYESPNQARAHRGFRVAFVPEPATAAFVMLALAGILRRR